MFYTYILKSKSTNKTYAGFTDDITRRLTEHNRGKVRTTKAYRPFELIHTDEFQTKKKAKQKELFYKATSGRRKIKKFLAGRGG